MRNVALKCALVVSLGAAPAAFAAQPHAAATVPVYDSTQVALGRYTVIKRVGVQDWESAFRIRGHPSLEMAQRAIVGEAARMGADGVINLTCFDQTDAMFKPDGYFCYGNAIRLNPVVGELKK